MSDTESSPTAVHTAAAALPASGHLDALRLSLAAQLAPSGWRKSLHWLAQQIAAGCTWEDALHHGDWHPPATLHALVATALASGQPALIVLEVLERRAHTQRSWRTLLSSLAYPLVLLVIALGLTGFTMFMICQAFDSSSVDPLFGIRDIEQVNLVVADLRHTLYGIGITMAWFALLVITIGLLATPLARFNLLGHIPLFGKPFRWLALGDFLARLAVFSRHQATLSPLLQTVAASYGNDPLSMIADRVSLRIAEGMSLHQALHRTILSDRQAGVALTLIDLQTNDFSQSVTEASQLLEQMACQTCERLSFLLPLFVLLLVASLMWATWSVCSLILMAGFSLLSSLI